MRHAASERDALFESLLHEEDTREDFEWYHVKVRGTLGRGTQR